MVTHELLVTIAIFEISGNIPSDVKSTKVLPLMGEQQHRPSLPQPPEQLTRSLTYPSDWFTNTSTPLWILGVIFIWLWCLASSICQCISRIALILRELKSERLVNVTDSRVSSPSCVSTPSRDRQRLYYVLTEQENKSCLQNFVGKWIIFPAPNNVAADVFRNVEDIRCNKQDIHVISESRCHPWRGRPSCHSAL